MALNFATQFQGKTFLMTGLANKKSIAYTVTKQLLEQGARIVVSVQTEAMKLSIAKLLPDLSIFVCDAEQEEQITALGAALKAQEIKLDGFLHSIAFANFEKGDVPFHKTIANDFYKACQISCFSFVQMANALESVLNPQASCVTISISDTKTTSYGHLGPIKAMLDSVVPFLAKSFSEFSEIRFNSVCPGPLKTAASAGIPNYLDNYLYAEQLTLRKSALKTEEVAATILFLLGPLSSGINGQRIVVDGGISCNYFDSKIVKSVVSHIDY
jgi:enoyl-[acyl-carrier protein] reductase I